MQKKFEPRLKVKTTPCLFSLYLFSLVHPPLLILYLPPPHLPLLHLSILLLPFSTFFPLLPPLHPFGVASSPSLWCPSSPSLWGPSSTFLCRPTPRATSTGHIHVLLRDAHFDERQPRTRAPGMAANSFQIGGPNWGLNWFFCSQGSSCISAHIPTRLFLFSEKEYRQHTRGVPMIYDVTVRVPVWCDSSILITIDVLPSTCMGALAVSYFGPPPVACFLVV
jgi:hypothetical protein